MKGFLRPCCIHINSYLLPCTEMKGLYGPGLYKCMLSSSLRVQKWRVSTALLYMNLCVPLVYKMSIWKSSGWENSLSNSPFKITPSFLSYRYNWRKYYRWTQNAKYFWCYKIVIFLHYCDSNISNFSIAPCIVIALNLLWYIYLLLFLIALFIYLKLLKARRSKKQRKTCSFLI